LAYRGFDLDRWLYRQVWFEQLLAGETPPQVERVHERLRTVLRRYLLDLRSDNSVQDSTLDFHGRNLIAFFVWLGQHGQDRGLDAIRSEHISAYLASFKTDGMTQGRKTVPGHSKAAWTMAKQVSVLRSLFVWANRSQLCAENPVERWVFDRKNRRTDPLPEEEIAQLIETWTNPETPPRDAMVGLMILVYGFFPRQLLALNCDAIDLATNVFHGLKVTVPIPLVLRPVLERYLAWRTARVDSLDEQSLVVSWQKGKYVRAKPTILVTALRKYKVNPRQLRVTALASTIQHGSLKLLSVFGLTTDGMKRYRDIARLTDNARKVNPKPNLW